MKLYLSSYGLGNKPDEMLPLVGDNKRTAIIMNAQDNTLPENRAERLQREIDGLTGLGLQPQELDLRSYFGKPNELNEAIADFGYFWVRGGNVFLLRRAYKQSGFDNLLADLLQKDTAAYGGFSAGVCVLAPSLRGIELVDPKDDVAEGYEKDVIWDGVGVLDYAIAPHYKSDHPESDDINKCVEYFADNHILFKALRDGEAIVINGDDERIVS
jgi:dipeptidase E